MAEGTKEMTAPLLMRIASWFAALFAFASVVVVSLAALGEVNFFIGGTAVDSQVWMQTAAPLLLLTGALMAVISYAFRKERKWSRHLVMAMWAVVALYGLGIGVAGMIARGLMLRAVLEALVFGTASAWYFYGKRNVVEYFNSLDGRARKTQ